MCWGVGVVVGKGGQRQGRTGASKGSAGTLRCLLAGMTSRHRILRCVAKHWMAKKGTNAHETRRSAAATLKTRSPQGHEAGRTTRAASGGRTASTRIARHLLAVLGRRKLEKLSCFPKTVVQALDFMCPPAHKTVLRSPRGCVKDGGDCTFLALWRRSTY